MQKAESCGHTGSGSLFFLAGIGAGIGLAVLFAPRSGAATRQLISRKVEEGESLVKEMVADAQDYVSVQGLKLGDRIKQVAEVIGHDAAGERVPR